MAIIRDIMPAFELFQPATTEDALALAAKYGSDAWVMAGGLDTFDWLKDRIKRPICNRPEPDQRTARHQTG
jgi:xanthine dehydrogenase YagS FAD-binding subunit